ncbi:MAG: hypothetical protein IIW40_01680 [Clostridia bacterium]|nr:hypothetical protein [Clostridia bacterium]
MGIKLHRSRRTTMFRHRRHPAVVVLGWGFAAVAVVAIGFFGAKFLNEHPLVSTKHPSYPTQSAPDLPVSSEPVESDPAPVTPSPTADTVRGFYLPMTALRDSVTLSGKLEQAAAAGFTGVIFDLKDSEGALYYRFTAPQAAQVNSFTADAFTTEELKSLFAAIRGAGLQPIPRLYAFRDHAGAKALAGARISLTSNSGWVWYDGDPQGAGRAWLNPYADEAHQYILALARELQQAGAAAILLDGVQFPTQVYSANFGSSSNTAMSRHEILTAFIEKMRQHLGDLPVILSSTCEGALGSNTTVYGNNPLTFAPTMAAPVILPGSLPATIRVGETTIQNTPDSLKQTVEALVGQMVLRTKVMAEDKQPVLSPWLQAEGYTAEQIRQEVAGCVAGGADSYILYHPQGSYDFAALKTVG